MDVLSVCYEVDFQKRFGTATGEAFGLIERTAQLAVESAGRCHSQRFGQIPEQFMKLPHDDENVEHLLGDSRNTPPVLPAERDLSDLLPCAEAFVCGATGKTLLPKSLMYGATEVRS
ncbi:MAG TPA: hypothetical protein VJ757_04540 [Pseudonocardiaceae bacterium]|nr:hypothetical protein [Pseudonocardiaceae bacterium]